MNNWMLEFVSKRAEAVEQRLNNDPYYRSIKKRRSLLLEGQGALTGAAQTTLEILDVALEGIIKDEFYLQGLRDGLELKREPEGVTFSEYYTKMTGGEEGG